MPFKYSLYGNIVKSDLNIPFLEPIKSDINADIIIKLNSNLKFNKEIPFNETLNSLNLRTASVENRYYKCVIQDGSLIEYKFKEKMNNIASLINFLHMPFAFVMFQKRYLPIHGMSFLHNNKSIIAMGASGSGKSSLSSILSKTHKIRSEDITCTIYKDNKIYSAPSFPIILSEADYSSHLKKFSQKEISRNRKIYSISQRYDDEALAEIERIYILEWGDSEIIRKLKNNEALEKLLISSFKPYPFNKCFESEKVLFTNLMAIIRNIDIFLYTREKNNYSAGEINLIKHIKDDTS